MASVRLKFRAPSVRRGEGALYFQIIHERWVRQIKTDYRIYASEWDADSGDIVWSSPVSEERDRMLKIIRDKIDWQKCNLQKIIEKLNNGRTPYKLKDVMKYYREGYLDRISIFEYIKKEVERQKRLGKERTGETYRQTLNSFVKFRQNVDISFDMLDPDIVGRYESFMRANGLSRNTTSFYMRILRCMYNRAVSDGLTEQCWPFRHVYTGVDKTIKRAISLKEIKRIKELDLSDRSDLDYARDIYLRKCMRQSKGVNQEK